jgi:hypothetical protein
MKYFKRKDNRGCKAQQKALERNCRAYQKQLARLQGRVSQQAWNFFAFGFAGWGLHDAILLSFAAGDGLDYQFRATEDFDVNKSKGRVRIQFLNRQRTMVYSFVCTDIRKVVFSYSTQDRRWDWHRIGLLETYELTAAGKQHLSLEFQFSSNTMLHVEFGRLKFLRQRVNRRQSPD